MNDEQGPRVRGAPTGPIAARRCADRWQTPYARTPDAVPGMCRSRGRRTCRPGGARPAARMVPAPRMPCTRATRCSGLARRLGKKQQAIKRHLRNGNRGRLRPIKHAGRQSGATEPRARWVNRSITERRRQQGVQMPAVGGGLAGLLLSRSCSSNTCSASVSTSVIVDTTCCASTVQGVVPALMWYATNVS